jgi:undecaprenyl-diphosphatase
MLRLFNYLYKKDKKIFLYLNKNIRCRALDIFMPGITHLGGATFTIVACFLLYILGHKETRVAATEAIITVAGSQGIVQVFKNSINRKRPYLVIPDVNTFWKCLLEDYSFPSGHTTAGFSLAVAVAINFPSYRFVSYSLATAVGISRIYTGMHYPSDVISGALLGAISAFLTHAARGMLA